VRGENQYGVPPLSLPPIDEQYDHRIASATSAARTSTSISPEELTQYEAVRLFIERARDVKADFDVTDENAHSIAEICVRLDGLPLAIELAAARVKMLPPQALLTRLSNRLDILTGGSRDAPA